ncbi:MAG TPA: penicillin-binding transpeptidase domain-containing protein, partial [Candidatus Limnocylindria bacterium]|nr:penicillin-binding transpeptidase domain-containing protein [Candidatus Limnocylindria bacterium]
MKLLRRNLRLAAGAVALLLVGLIAYGAYSLNVFGNRWFSSSANTALRRVKQGVTPGRILDRSGLVLADNGPDGKRTYHPDALTRSALVHLLGDSEGMVAYGAESFLASLLYDFGGNYLGRLGAFFRGEQPRGMDVRLSVDSALTRRAAELFPKGKSGAVIVLNWKTGEVLALSSFPGFDPNSPVRAGDDDPAQPYWNRATRWLSAPGSTFKVVTMASALQRLPGATAKTYTCTGAFMVDGTLITDAGGAVHGELTLRDALAVSCNITFAKAALEAGDEAMRKTARAFGIGDYLLFSDLVVENSGYPASNRVSKEIAWTGAGQSALSITPLHMAMVASGIANGGMMMEPKLLLSAMDAAGISHRRMAPEVYRTPLTPTDAATIRAAMRRAVTHGTASRARVDGLTVCGKTGSAQVDRQENTNAWFIGFIQEENHPYAISVVVQDAGGGGEIAAPIAGELFKYLRQHAPAGR